LEEDLEKVKEIILQQVDTANPAISTGLRKIALSTGKLLRPTFFLLSGRLGKFDKKKMYSLAAAVEMLHLATLIHDDIVDDSPLRRGQPALHVTEGRKNAVLMGDFLFSRCFHLTSQYAKIQNARILSAAVGRICESEIQERAPVIPSIRSYLRKTAGKTAVLFVASCFAGASEARCSPFVSNYLRRAGYNIGMGFQIIDDILDYTSSSVNLGKPVGNDLKSGIYTLPLILSARKNQPGINTAVQALQRKEIAAEEVIGMVKDLGGVEEAREYAQRYTNRAIESLEELPQGWPKEALLTLTRDLLFRTY